ncbi:MAG: ABC transporter permease [Methanomethylovorans sp.]|uniref:ABC transporter permease n=1 Tax=Methanomethylovorans sp. TaxID=2758717 RepID=UPI003530A0A8
MKLNTANILTLAQKEFADNVYSTRFRVLLALVIVILLSGSISDVENQSNIFEEGSFITVYTMGTFLPILGLALGYDAIVKEKVSDSLNTLLTHPVFRDNIILGKITGGFLTLALVIILSIISSIGVTLVLTGIPVSMTEINRIIVFSFVSFIYISVFFALGVLFSVVFNNPAKSFITGIVLWAVFILAFGQITALIASVTTGEVLYSENEEHAQIVDQKLQYLSPLNHYFQAVAGISISYDEEDLKTSTGLFDMSHSLGQWLNDYWTNIVLLAIVPFLLIISSLLIFIKQDITRG